jgi:hypothetical protein
MMVHRTILLLKILRFFDIPLVFQTDDNFVGFFISGTFPLFFRL